MKLPYRYAAIAAVVIILATVLLCGIYSYGTFSLEDYSSYCVAQDTPVCGHHIDSRNDAVRASRALLHEIYGLPALSTVCCSVAYDSRNDCWLVDAMSPYVWCSQCSPLYGTTGGEYHVILSSSGQVHGIWAEM